MFVCKWFGRVVFLGVLGIGSVAGVAQSLDVPATGVNSPAGAKSTPSVATKPVSTSYKVSEGSGGGTPAAAAQNIGEGDVPVTPKLGATSATSGQTLSQQIAALPALNQLGVAVDVDVDRRGKEILAHLGAVLRYYRSVTGAPLQKVGEPSDVLYSEQATAQATEAARTAFLSARSEAALLLKLEHVPKPGRSAAVASAGGAGGTAPAGPDQTGGVAGTDSGSTPGQASSADVESGNAPALQTEAQRMAEARVRVQGRLNDLLAQDAALDRQIATARPKDLPVLRQQDEQLEGQVRLQKAILDALDQVGSLAQTHGGSGLLADIDRLQRSAPELLSSVAKPIAPSLLQTLGSARDSGVSSQATVLIQLLSTRQGIEGRIRQLDDLRSEAEELRTPMVKLLRATIAAGDAAMQAAPDPKASSADIVTATRKHYDQLTAAFRVMSTATLPLSQEIVLLEGSRANLLAWRAAVDAEYKSVMRSLLLRVLAIALTLALLAVVSNVWQRGTVKYVKDMRRRRQLIVVRRLTIGFLTGVVLIFGFVTQFNSLATFAGFITAGIAVGLQTILLSVAAYFFIVGRFGVRVGDRITVAGVTGDVVDVGLVRFYMLELTGTGTELHATGRVAVFANSVLFQAGTPLYKQMPGTEYAWHELTVKLKPDTDYKPATEAVLRAVQTVFATYQARILEQHRAVESWMDTAVETPNIEPRLQLAEGGLQYAVLYPVEIKSAATTDEQIVHQLLSDMASEAGVKDAIAAPPTVKAVIKG